MLFRFTVFLFTKLKRKAHKQDWANQLSLVFFYCGDITKVFIYASTPLLTYSNKQTNLKKKPLKTSKRFYYNLINIKEEK